MATTTGEFRESLIEAIGAIRTRKISAEEGTAIAKLAQQISLSMQVESNIRREEKIINKLGNTESIGQLCIGENIDENNDRTSSQAIKSV